MPHTSKQVKVDPKNRLLLLVASKQVANNYSTYEHLLKITQFYACKDNNTFMPK